MSTVEWSRPRQTPMAGHRKATHRWCAGCEALHRTHRHALGEEECPAMAAEQQREHERRFAGPLIARPRAPRQTVKMNVAGITGGPA